MAKDANAYCNLYSNFRIGYSNIFKTFLTVLPSEKNVYPKLRIVRQLLIINNSENGQFYSRFSNFMDLTIVFVSKVKRYFSR